MPAERRFGMDHPHYDWSPLSRRGILRWPDNARVALCVIIDLEKPEWDPPADSFTTPFAGGLAPRPFPDYARMSHREYGHRVGIFRVLDTLRKHGIPATVAMDAMTAENYPYLVQHCQDAGAEIIGHGVSLSRMITSNMSEAEERDYISQSVSALTQATGSAPAGWLGPEYGESARTPQLLSEAGLRYVCDWVNDEQPYPLHSPHGEMFTLPVMWELDDVGALWERQSGGRAVSAACLEESFETLYEDGQQNGRLMALNLHPWLIGQPFRIGYLDRALGRMMRRGGVWAATGSQIIDWYQDNPPTA